MPLENQSKFENNENTIINSVPQKRFSIRRRKIVISFYDCIIKPKLWMKLEKEVFVDV